ncbi:hypothetical protein Q7P35_011226 [Cladosporium inversicolor]
MPAIRVGAMNVRSLKVTISCGGTDVIILPVECSSAPAGQVSPSSSDGSTSDSDTDSSSSFYGEDDDSDMTDSSFSPLLSSMRYTRFRRASLTWQRAQDIRCMHFDSMCTMKASLEATVPLVTCRGGSPIFSPVATVPQTPNEAVAADAADDDDLDEIYRGYRHMTTLLDLDEVDGLTGLQSPTHPNGHDNSDTSTQPNVDPFFDFDFDFTEPAPPMTDVWIDPYGIPPGSYAEHLVVMNVAIDSDNYYNAYHILANSGLNFLTDYPLTTSPRKCVFEISAILRRTEFWTPQSEETIPVDNVLAWPQVLTKVRTSQLLFSPFSYTSEWQPQTEHVRKTESEPRSPRSMSPGFGLMFEA